MAKETRVFNSHESDYVHAAIRLHQHFTQLHAELFQILLGMKESTKTADVSQCQRVDARHLLNKTYDMLDDMRKEVKNTVELIDKITCMIWVKDEDSAGESIRGEIATGSPRVKMGVHLPGRSRDPERYAKLMEYFGVSDKAVETGAVRANWPGVVEFVSQLAEAGEPLPPGVDPSKQYPIYALTTRQHRKVEIQPKEVEGPSLPLA